MTARYKVGQTFICHWIDRILQHAQTIKSLQDRICQFHIFSQCTRAIISTSNRIRCCNHCTTRLQTRHNTSLGQRNTLLFHCLVNRCPILFIHLIKLINKAYSSIRKDKCTTFQCPLFGHGILVYTCRKTYSTCTLSSGIHSSRRSCFCILQHLTLGCSRITQQQDIHITTNPMFIINIFRNSTKKTHSQCHFHLFMSINRRSNTSHNTITNLRITRQLQYLRTIRLRQISRRRSILLLPYMIGRYKCRKHRKTRSLCHMIIITMRVHTRNFHLFPRTRGID
mmetsp:Transcript_3255/g.3918  ORF Transcript_3255/g.3918 Transcript_3255/m.3918 type:complete len:282 (-) Transcript_3255:919-1764(-)